MNRKKLTTEEFIKRAEIVHGNKYDYSKSNYVNAHKKVIIICKKHGDFLQAPNHHLGGQGCRECGNKKLTTEKFIKKAEKIHGHKYNYSKVDYINAQIWLDSLNIPDEYREKTIKLPNGKRYIVDALFNDVIYEFNGDFWHGNPNIFDPNEINPMNNKSYGELYKMTVKKKNDLMKYGYKIISIWESDFIKQVGVE
jgi:hypothetical protein